ncbi:hypothetical protein [Maridesulfovibrio ferrireducens]|uniref:hypothetical protein n=1 Tax=Maridesulfovibrio ferrireducens TaxID=246191 RepID=UPI001A2E22EE|nr:hypothetical protein [Maridesulfovibrio ferrireducens]MBI9113087.1 hypothetical protein [Maridesulfovibrio ferrireducens]
MKLNRFLIITTSLSFLLLAGCAVKRPAPNAEVNFEVPSKLSIIKKDSLLRIIPTTTTKKETPGFARELAAKLNHAGYFKVGNGPNPRYVLNLDTFWADRCDNSKQTSYNVRYYKKAIENKDGSGHDIMVKDYGASYTAALVGGVSIYQINNLEPLAYFNVVAKDTKWVREQNKNEAKVSCDTKGTRSKLMAEIIKNIDGLLSKERRNIPVIFPSGGDAEAKGLILSNQIKKAHKKLESLVTPVPLSDLTPARYEQWEKEAEQNQTPKRVMSEDLANFYLLYMTKEARGISEQSAEVIHDGYARILLLAEDKTLIDATADSMARLEETAKRLGIML